MGVGPSTLKLLPPHACMLFLTYFSIVYSLAVDIGGCDSDIVVTILSQLLSSEGDVVLYNSQISVSQCNGLSSVNIHKSQLGMTHWSRLSILIAILVFTHSLCSCRELVILVSCLTTSG